MQSFQVTTNWYLPVSHDLTLWPHQRHISGQWSQMLRLVCLREESFCILFSACFSPFNVDRINCVDATLYRTYSARCDHAGIVVEDDVQLLEAGLDVVMRRETRYRRPVPDVT